MAGFFNRLKEGLTKTRNNIVNGIDSVFSGFSTIDEDFYEELEEILIMADVGVNTTDRLMESVRKGIKKKEINTPEDTEEAEEAREE